MPGRPGKEGPTLMVGRGNRSGVSLGWEELGARMGIVQGGGGRGTEWAIESRMPSVSISIARVHAAASIRDLGHATT
jgi:hypothetical protein